MTMPAARPEDASGTARGSDAALELDHVLVDGLRLRVGHRGPAWGQARGTAVILPGRAEFIEKYGETVAALAARRFAVAILDWRGQGGSDRLLDKRHRGHVVRIEDYLADLAGVLAHLEQRRLPRPWLMLAHSMGGHVGLRHLHDRPGSFAGAVMSAPMFGIRLQPMPEPLARAICEIALGLGAGQRYAPGQRDFDLARCLFERNNVTSCPVQFEDLRRRLAATPELALGGVTYGWLTASLRSIALIRRPGFVEAIATPVLVCQAGHERVVCNRSIAAITRRLPHGRLLVFPEARHELLQERDPIRRRLLDAFTAFADEIRPGP
jgi:lysophospholipase